MRDVAAFIMIVLFASFVIGGATLVVTVNGEEHRYGFTLEAPK